MIKSGNYTLKIKIFTYLFFSNLLYSKQNINANAKTIILSGMLNVIISNNPKIKYNSEIMIPIK